MIKILYALRFLTILPIPWKQEEDLTDVARSVIFFPLVGLLIGIFISVSSYLLLFKFSPVTVAVLVTLLWVISTGGLHLDGLSDLFDSFGGRTREERLKIMKDSSIGVFGALSLILIILLKIALLREILLRNSSFLNYGIILSPGWARLFEVLAIRFFNSARVDGLGNFFKKEIRSIDWIIPTVSMVILSTLLLKPTRLLFIPVAIGVLWLFAKSTSKRLGGLTGDCYGAICEISEVLLILLFAL